MAGCECSSACCGSAAYVDDYEYGPAPYVDGSVRTPVGDVPRVTTRMTAADRRSALRVRLAIGRDEYRVRPGLYAIGEPDDTSPVLVSANYKLSFDALRSELTDRDVWLLVIDSKGINVWCAAGKGTFGTAELVRSVQAAHLGQVVSHQKLVVPQLGASGIAAHEVRQASGFRVVYGPVRATDVPAFLDAGMTATPAMRRIAFPLRDRAALVGAELSRVRNPWVLASAALILLGGFLGVLPWRTVALLAAASIGTLVAGGIVVPLALPWIPGRMFAVKGALAGTLVAALVIAVAGRWLDVWGMAALVLATAAVAAFIAMSFTGSTTFTSLSGVLREMRRALPVEAVTIGAAAVAVVLSIVL